MQSFSVFCKYIYAGKKKWDCAVFFFFISIVLIMCDVFLLVNNSENEMLLMCF